MPPVYVKIEPAEPVLYTRNLGAAISYYIMLGFRVMYGPEQKSACVQLPGAHEIGTQGAMVSINILPHPAFGIIPLGRVTIDLATGIRDGPDDIQFLYDSFVRAAGNRITRMPSPPTKSPDGSLREFLAPDLDGNLFHFRQQVIGTILKSQR